MKSLATAYMTRKFSRGGRIKTRPEPSDAPAQHEEMPMCEHGGPVMCSKGCYADGGEVSMGSEAEDSMTNPKLEASKMFDGGMLEDDEESGSEIMGDEDEDMINERLDHGPAENEMGSNDENMGAKKFAKGGMMKSRILGKILGGISKMHRGM